MAVLRTLFLTARDLTTAVLGKLTLTPEGDVLKSSGDLQNDANTARVVSKILAQLAAADRAQAAAAAAAAQQQQQGVRVAAEACVLEARASSYLLGAFLRYFLRRFALLCATFSFAALETPQNLLQSSY